MYKVTTKSEWFLVPIGRPLKSNTEYTATEKRKFHGSYFDYWGYCINGTWYNANIFKKIKEMNTEIKEELIGRQFKCIGIAHIRNIVYTISKSEKENCYRIIWRSERTGKVEETLSYAEQTHKNIEKGNWVLEKEAFKLPDKWVVTCGTEEEIEIINKFLHIHCRNYRGYVNTWRHYGTIGRTYKSYFHYPQASSSTHSDLTIANGYTEITFEQFKKYVLKEGVVTQETSVEVKSYTYSEIEKIIKKDFGKEDADEILLSIKKIR